MFTDRTGDNSNILTDYNINTTAGSIYASITARSLTDLYKDINAEWNVEQNKYDYSNGAPANHARTTGEGNTQDKLWLLSVEEMSTLFWGSDWDNMDYASAVWHEMYWWLRSPDCSVANFAFSVGDDGDYGGYDAYYCYDVARPAFQLAL